jgi:hypothetical protein
MRTVRRSELDRPITDQWREIQRRNDPPTPTILQIQLRKQRDWLLVIIMLQSIWMLILILIISLHK